MTQREKADEKLRDLLQMYGVRERENEAPTYFEEHMREALKDLFMERLSLHAYSAIYSLLDGALGRALGRDPALPWLVGVKKASANVPPGRPG